ncbi:hypothetical protein HK097_006174 [Rhizophlyctis rosea]|uniref:AA9 family lytic polysaccharide monooxygenase n=1 Tax=Rhizophlyctis rosea TaxID=64517 RepID=A0AAD5SJU0_9FUNG|nr:hypothetical protein HK097_006174 [Rhizophlyctis rosea]
MFKALAILALAASAQAHYFVDSINGETSCLRALVLNAENSPVTGNAINTADITCGSARPGPAASAITLAAGSTVSAKYNPGAYHAGPCAVYVQKKGTSTWAKIHEYLYQGNSWCSDWITQNGNTYKFTVPSQLESGEYVFRVEHLGLHVAQSAGGAQFYIRCFDAIVTGGGGQTPSPQVSFPGAYSTTTPGVVWNMYGNNGNSAYPRYGPAVATFSGSSSGGNPGGNPTTTEPTRTTTTTTTTQQANCAQKSTLNPDNVISILSHIKDPAVIASVSAVSISYLIYSLFFKPPPTNAVEFTNGTLPILGIVPVFARHKNQFYKVLDMVSEQCGTFGYFRALHTQIYMISDGVLGKEMLNSVFDRFRRADSLRRTLGGIIGNPNVIILLDDEPWKAHRKILVSSMSTSHLLKSIPQINGTLDDLIATWEEQRLKGDDVVDVQKNMSDVALEALCRALLNIKFDVFNRNGGGKYGDASKHVEGMARGMDERVGKTALQVMFLKSDHKASMDALRALMKQLIEEKRELIAKRGDAKPDDSEVDVIETLITHPDGLSDHDLIDELLIFFIAGHETSANTMATTLKLLAEFPGYQDRIYQELVDCLGTNAAGLANFPATNEEMMRLKLVDASIKEALRLHPVAPAASRHTRVPVTLGGKYLIPAGVDVMVNIRHMQRNPAFWPDAETFKPERWFEPETVKNPHYMPFAHGPQVCLGMRWANIEMRLTIARIVGKYKLELVPGQVFEEKMVMTIGFKDGIRIKLTPRG